MQSNEITTRHIFFIDRVVSYYEIHSFFFSLFMILNLYVHIKKTANYYSRKIVNLTIEK